MPLTITAHMLRHVLTCERRAWLDQNGDGALRVDEASAKYRYAEGQRHEHTVNLATSSEIHRVMATTWEEGVDLTRRLMREGVPGILSGHLEAVWRPNGDSEPVILRGKADQLRRVSHYLGRWIYEPIEIKRYEILTNLDRIQLDLYLYLLQQWQEVEVSGKFFLGRDADGYYLNECDHALDQDRLDAAITRLIDTTRLSAAPPVIIEPHCKDCPWYKTCLPAAGSRLGLSALPGLQRKTREALEKAEIKTVSQLAMLELAELRRFWGMGETKAHKTHASAHAWVQQRPVWINKLPPKCTRPGVMFDLETLQDASLPRGKDTIPWSLGWREQDGTCRIVIIAPNAPDTDTDQYIFPDGAQIQIERTTDEGWERFAEAMNIGDFPIYHWSPYDAGILKATAPQHVKDALANRMIDLCKVCENTVRLPLPGYSLKVVAPYLGFSWPGGNDDWFVAYQNYRRWLYHDDLSALANACVYQRADVDGLAVVWQWLNETMGT